MSSAAQGFDQNLAPSGSGAGNERPEVTITSRLGIARRAMCASSTPLIRPARLTSVIISESAPEFVEHELGRFRAFALDDPVIAFLQQHADHFALHRVVLHHQCGGTDWF